MTRLVFALVALAVASAAMVGCEKKVTMPTSTPKETVTDVQKMTVPSGPPPAR